MDETMRLSCPNCRAIEWFRDGTTMAADINGEIHRVRIKGVVADPGWHCERCGFQPAPGSDLTKHLVDMQLVLAY